MNAVERYRKAKKQTKQDGTHRKHLGGIYLLGACVAAGVSWAQNASLMLAVLHGGMSWLYVLLHAVGASINA